MQQLTPKQELFLEEYLETWNGTKSYQKIYGCSKNSARAAAARLLNTNPLVKQIVKERRKELTECYQRLRKEQIRRKSKR